MPSPYTYEMCRSRPVSGRIMLLWNWRNYPLWSSVGHTWINGYGSSWVERWQSPTAMSWSSLMGMERGDTIFFCSSPLGSFVHCEVARWGQCENTAETVPRWGRLTGTTVGPLVCSQCLNTYTHAYTHTKESVHTHTHTKESVCTHTQHAHGSVQVHKHTNTQAHMAIGHPELSYIFALLKLFNTSFSLPCETGQRAVGACRESSLWTWHLTKKNLHWSHQFF